MKRIASYAVAILVALALVPVVATPAGAIPGEPTLDSPADGVTVNANPVLRWDPVAGATSYRVQVSTTPAFSATVFNVTTPNTAYGHPTDLPLGQLYWRVAAIDGSGQGPFSTERGFTKAAPDSPVLTSPTDGEVLHFPTDPYVLTWDPFPGADHYEVQIDNEDSFTGASTVNTTNPTYTATTTPTIGQPVYWRVRAISPGNVASQYADSRSFSFDWPDAPVLVAPVDDNSPGNAIEEVVFDWTPVDGAVTYDLQASPNDQFTSFTLNVSNIHGTRYSPPTTIDNGAYYWRVRARNYGGGIDDWSEVSTFYRAWPAPDSPPNHRVELLTPEDGDLEVGLPEFSWTPVRLASTYQLELGDDPNFSPGSYTTCTTQHTTFIPVGSCDPDPGDTYYWRVKPIDGPAGINGLYSETFSFVHDPGIPTLLTPPDGSTGLVAPVELTWSPVNNDNGGEVSKYRVTILDSSDGTAETATTFATSYVPQNLDPADGPFSWYVQILTESGDGIIPAASSAFEFDFSQPSSFSATPEPITPDGTTDYKVPTLEWEPVSGAESYEIWRSPGSGIYSLFKGGLKVPGYAHTGSSVTGTFQWFVRAKLDGGGSIDSLDHGSFTVAPMEASVLQAPAHCPPNTSCPLQPDTPTLQWAWDPQASHYLIYLAADPNFTNMLSGYNGVAVHYPRYRPTTNLPDAQAGQAIYWYARPCYGTSPEVCGPGAGTFAGANPPVRAFRKKSNPIVLVSPADEAEGATPSPTHANEIVFDWQDYLASNLAAANPADLEARNYVLEIDTTEDMDSPIHTSPLLDQTTYTVFSATLPDGPLYWRVQAYDASNNALSFSEPWLVNKRSPQASLDEPDDDEVVSSTPLFSWASQDFAARYTLEVYRNPDSAITTGNRVVNVTTPLISYIPTSALPAGEYGWRVRRLDADGRAGPWTADTNTGLQRFTVAGNAVTLLTPAQGANFPNNDQSFTWTPAPGAAQYRFQADDNADFSSPFEQVTTVMTSWHSTKVYPNGTYHWRVQSVDGDGNITATSVSRTFTHGPPPPPSTWFHPLTPVRILDSRPGSGNVGPYDTRWGAGTTRDVEVAGFGGVPADAEAVALNVTVTSTTAASFLSIWPKGQAKPTTSVLNWKSGQTIANAATVKVGTNELVSVYNQLGNTHVIFDVVGYYDDDSGTGGGLTPQTPKRLLDTRSSTKVGAGAVRDLVVAGGTTGVPADADAVVLNVTATNPTAGSFLTVWPEGDAMPTASSLNFSAGQTIPNAVTASVGDDGEIQIFNNAGSVDVIVDVVGYFDQGSGAPYRPLPSPVRIQDSRPATRVGPFSTRWAAGTVRDITVTGAPSNVPTSAVGALLNVTVTNTTGSSFLTIWPDGVTMPSASSLNWTPGVTIANSVTSKLGGPAAANLGKISAYNQTGSTDVIMDVYGYYGP